MDHPLVQIPTLFGCTNDIQDLPAGRLHVHYGIPFMACRITISNPLGLDQVVIGHMQDHRVLAFCQACQIVDGVDLRNRQVRIHRLKGLAQPRDDDIERERRADRP